MDKKMTELKMNNNVRILVQLLALLAVSRLFMLIMVPVYNAIMGTDRTFSFLMNEWDAKRYWFIVENGYTFPLDYDPQANWAFFPLYVLVCMAVKAMTFWKADTYCVGMLVSNVCIFAAAFVTVKYIRCATGVKPCSAADVELSSAGSAKLGGTTGVKLGSEMVTGASQEGLNAGKFRFDRDVLLVGCLMFMAPYTFYSSSMYTEAMFIMFIAFTFYACQQRRFLLAGVCAALASGTRIVGCTLVFAMIIEMYRYYRETGILGGCAGDNGSRGELSHSVNRRSLDSTSGKFGAVLTNVAAFVVNVLKRPVDLISILLCPLGTFAYMGFLRFFCGDVWAFLHVQIAWRDDEYFPIFGVLWKACTGQIEPRYTYMGWFCIGVFVMYAYLFVKKHYSMAVFGIISLLVPLCSHVMSTCRFTVGSYVIYIAFYELLSNLCGTKLKNAARILIIVGFIVAETVLIFNWYNSDCWLM